MVKLNKNLFKKKNVLIIFGVAFILAITLFKFTSGDSASDEVFTEIKPKKVDMTITVLSTGSVDPQNRLAITPTVAGRMETISVDEGDNVSKGQIIAWMSSTERAALIDAARASGKEAVAKWEELYKPTPIIAPIDGTIIVRNVEEGQTVTNSTEIFVMSDRLTVKAQVDETDIASVKLRDRSVIVLDAYPDKPIESYIDKIAYDATTVNSVTTYIVDVVPYEVPNFMRSGMTANITSYVEEKKGVLALPTDAIRAEGSEFYVLVKKDKNKSYEPENRIRKNISVGSSDGNMTEILSGINENDVVLLRSTDLSKRTQAKKAMFGPPSRKR